MSETRDFIIDEAYKLFLQQSYEAVSISTISEAIGMTKGALYHHFTNKEDLFKAVIDKHFPHFVEGTECVFSSLKELIEKTIGFSEKILRSLNPTDLKFDPVSFIGLMSDAFRHYPEFNRQKMAETDQCISNIKAVVAKAVEGGEIRNDIDVTVVAKQIFATGLGAALEILHNYTIEETINTMRAEMQQFYALLKV